MKAAKRSASAGAAFHDLTPLAAKPVSNESDMKVPLQKPRTAVLASSWRAVSYTHLDVYKRQVFGDEKQ